jgi:hypothetical protein
MTIVTAKTFIAHFTIGLYTGYSSREIRIDEVKHFLSIGQEKIKKEANILLSAKISLCNIVCLGQDEPSVEISFIQYPKFPVDESSLKVAITDLAIFMMEKLEQNRTVIIFPDETLMLEKTSEIDPKIK